MRRRLVLIGSTPPLSVCGSHAHVILVALRSYLRFGSPGLACEHVIQVIRRLPSRRGRLAGFSPGHCGP
jgi:hypothetical protein